MHIVLISGRVSKGDLGDLSACDLSELILRAVLSHSIEEGIDHGVGVSLSALDGEATVEEASVYQHLPHYGMTPIVWL